MPNKISRRIVLLSFACAALLIVPLSRGRSLPEPEADAGGGLLRVSVEAGAPVLERLRNGATAWERPLPAVPRFLVAGASGAAIAGTIRFDDASQGWARVFTADGESWDVPGAPRRVHLSADGRRVLVQTSVDGKALTRVHEVSGAPVADLSIDFADHLSVELSKAGDAVILAPGGEDDADEILVHDLDSGTVRSVQMPEGETAEQAIAIDATRLVTLGGGILRFHDLERQGGSWGRRPAAPYSTLLGVSDDGRRILVSVGGGSYEVLDDKGEVIWMFQPTAPTRELQSALAAVEDLRQVQAELLGMGGVLLHDRDSGRRYLVHSPGSADSRIQPVPAGALVNPSGRIVGDLG